MKVSHTYYNKDGELMAPTELDVKLAGTTPGGPPSKDAGFYHRHKIEGRTVAEYKEKRRRFFEEMSSVPRCMILSVREYDVRMDAYVRFGVEVLYAIETAEGAAAPYDKRIEILRALERYSS